MLENKVERKKIIIVLGLVLGIWGMFFIFLILQFKNYLYKDIKPQIMVGQPRLVTPTPSFFGHYYQSTTDTIGSLGERTFYRTNFLRDSSAFQRMKNIGQGVFDPIANRTYIVYQGGIRYYNNDEYSATDPYIIAYNHSNNQWEGPVKLGGMDAESDGHNYPQVVVDKQGYLHVFHTFHCSGRDIAYFKSKQPYLITSGFERQKIPNTSCNTYGAAFIDKEGEIYVFYRGGGAGQIKNCDDQYCRDDNNPTSPLDECVFYEPEMYVKSTDRGTTWEGPFKLIDPGPPPNPQNEHDNWRTVYTEDFNHDVNRNMIALTFRINEHHYCKEKLRSFINFNLSDDQIYAVNGVNYGSTLDANEYDTQRCCTYVNSNNDLFNKLTDLDDHKVAMSRAIVIHPVSGDTSVFYTWPDNQWKTHLIKADWRNNQWQYADLSQPPNDIFGDVSSVIDGTIDSVKGIDLYVKTKWGGSMPVPYCSKTPSDWPETACYQNPLRIFNYTDASGWRNIRYYQDKPDYELRGVSYVGVIPNGHPSIKALIQKPLYDSTHWTVNLSNHSNMYALVAYNVLGESPLNQTTPNYSSCVDLPCSSWNTININGCNLTEWQKKPDSLKCQTTSDRVWINGNNPTAYMMRFINTNPQGSCSEISELDPNWSSWEEYSDYRYWQLSSGMGNKKVCVQYKNGCGKKSPICGGMIDKR